MTLLLKQIRAKAEYEHGSYELQKVAFEGTFVIVKCSSVGTVSATLKMWRKWTVSYTACLPCCTEMIPKDEREKEGPSQGGRTE